MFESWGGRGVGVLLVYMALICEFISEVCSEVDNGFPCLLPYFAPLSAVSFPTMFV